MERKAFRIIIPVYDSEQLLERQKIDQTTKLIISHQ